MRRLLSDFGFDRASFYGRYETTAADALDRMQAQGLARQDPLTGVRGAALLLGRALDASALASSRERITDRTSLDARDAEMYELTELLRGSDVTTTVRRLYGLNRDELPKNASCTDAVRRTLLKEIDWQKVRVHRVGTTSLLLKAPVVGAPRKHHLIKLVHLFFQGVPPIAVATSRYHDAMPATEGSETVANVLASGDGWIIEEFIDGLTLTEYVAKWRADGAPSDDERLKDLRNVFIPIVGALADLHGRGVVHGDLNPSNIILTGTTVRSEARGHHVAGDGTAVRFIDLGRNLLASDIIGRVRSPDAHFVAPEVVELPPAAPEPTFTADYYSLGLLLPLCMGFARAEDLGGGQVPDELVAWSPLLTRVMLDLADPRAAKRLVVLHRDGLAPREPSSSHGRTGWPRDGHRAPSAEADSGRPGVPGGDAIASARDLMRLSARLEEIHELLCTTDERTGVRGDIGLLVEVLGKIRHPGDLLHGMTAEMRRHRLPRDSNYRYLATWMTAAGAALWLAVALVIVSLWARHGDDVNFDILHSSADQLRLVLSTIGVEFDPEANDRYDQVCAVGLSFAFSVYLYYKNAFRFADLRGYEPRNGVSLASEVLMRCLSVLALPFVVAAIFVTPGSFVLFSAIGTALVAITSFFVWKRQNDVIRYVHATVRSEGSPIGYWEKLGAAKRLLEWVPMLLEVAGLYVVMACTVLVGLAGDLWLYALWITTVNILGFGLTQAKRSREEIAPSLVRTGLLAERLKE